jgi:hippurate hydrolase
MTLAHNIKQLHADMRQWRQHLHQFPETAFEEVLTAKFIADKLASFGLQVHQGLGETGVVATLSVGDGSKKIALRADMDALLIQEQNTFSYKSCHDGRMHACGHDGHSAMLLGAAKYLSENRSFNGTVYFIFQPAEEGQAGAKRMIDDGLFEMFPADCVFGMHNFPDIPVGHFAVKPGAMMASSDCFEITITGKATHAAIPHLGNDAIVVTAQVINALQTIVSRTVDPADCAVVSITQIHAGNTWNAIPESVVLRGTFRSFDKQVKTLIADKIVQLVNNICAAFDVVVDIQFNPESEGYPVTFNTEVETAMALKAAQIVAGKLCVNEQPTPSMGAEDFSFMLHEKPGCYIWIGNGSSENSCLLHNPHYDFNDEILPVGAAYWVTLVELMLI